MCCAETTLEQNPNIKCLEITDVDLWEKLAKWTEKYSQLNLVEVERFDSFDLDLN